VATVLCHRFWRKPANLFRSTDLYDRGFGEVGVDFLMSQSGQTTSLPIRRTIALKVSSLAASNSRNENLGFCLRLGIFGRSKPSQNDL